MSNNAAHEVPPNQSRMGGRFAGGMEDQAMGHRPQHSARELDPAVTGLVAWLPPAGESLSKAAIDRWTEAARSVLMLAYQREEEPAG